MKILINNSTSQLVGMTVEQYRSLRQVLSYKVAGSYFSGDPNGGMRYLVTKKGEFATGLLGRVKAWAKKHNIPLESESSISPPPPYPLKLKAKLGRLKPYPIQREAAKRCAAKHRGYVTSPTGSGKSVMIALTIEAINHRTLVVTPSLELKRQMTESLTQFFGAQNVGELGKPIAVMNVQSLDPSTPLVGYPCLIIDEWHHSAAATYRALNAKAWKQVYYRIGYSATPHRGDVEEKILLEGILSKEIYHVSYDTAVKGGFIVPLEAYYIELPKTTSEGRIWAQVYKDLVVNNHHRNATIHALLQSLRYGGKSALCLVKEIAHGLQLTDNYTPFAHGENPDTENLIAAFNRGGTTLIGTTGVLGEGVDTKPCEYVLICGLGKSRPAFMQACGRAMRTYPGKNTGKVIIFYDKSHKWTKEHFKTQCKILAEEYACIPLKLDIG